MTAIAEVHDQCTAVMSLDDLMRFAAAAMTRSETSLKQCFDRRISAGLQLIKAREICRERRIPWAEKLREYGIDRTLAYLAISEAGGDPSIEHDYGGRSGGIKAKPPDHRAGQQRDWARKNRAAKRQHLLSTSTTTSSDPQPIDGQTIAQRQSTTRDDKLALVAAFFAKQPDQFIDAFIVEHIQ